MINLLNRALNSRVARFLGSWKTFWILVAIGITCKVLGI